MPHYNILFLCTGNSAKFSEAYREAFFMLDRRIRLFSPCDLPVSNRLALKQKVDDIGRQ